MNSFFSQELCLLCNKTFCQCIVYESCTKKESPTLIRLIFVALGVILFAVAYKSPDTLADMFIHWAGLDNNGKERLSVDASMAERGFEQLSSYAHEIDGRDVCRGRHFVIVQSQSGPDNTYQVYCKVSENDYNYL